MTCRTRNSPELEPSKELHVEKAYSSWKLLQLQVRLPLLKQKKKQEQNMVQQKMMTKTFARGAWLPTQLMAGFHIASWSLA